VIGASLAGQILECFETAVLLFEEAILAIADQVSDSRGIIKGGGFGGIQSGNTQQRNAKPRPEGERRHVRSLET